MRTTRFNRLCKELSKLTNDSCTFHEIYDLVIYHCKSIYIEENLLKEQSAINEGCTQFLVAMMQAMIRYSQIKKSANIIILKDLPILNYKGCKKLSRFKYPIEVVSIK